MFSVNFNKIDADNSSTSDLFIFLNYLKNNHAAVKFLNDSSIKLES